MRALLYAPDGTVAATFAAVLLLFAVLVFCLANAWLSWRGQGGRHRDGGLTHGGRRCIAAPVYVGWRLGTSAGSSAVEGMRPRSPADGAAHREHAVPAWPVSAGEGGHGPGTDLEPWPPPYRLAPMLDRALVCGTEEVTG